VTEAQLRRAVLHNIHALTGSMEPWKHAAKYMRQYLGPWLGMSATERWDTLSEIELELLLDALRERAAMVALDEDASGPREVVVCGGRDYEPTRADGAWVTWWLGFLAAKTVVHGGARGVDRWAGTLGTRLDLEVVVVLPDYDRYPGHVAPLERNTVMANRPNVVGVLALPGERGTADMVAKATARGLPVWLRSDPATDVRRWAA
jgi:hypothetical protein